MKSNIMIVALLITIFCAAAVSSADETNSVQSNLTLLMLQHKLQGIQAQLANAAATQDQGLQAVDIKGSYTGTASGMNPNGNCIPSAVKLIITKQCGNFAKGSITALGVTVPVTGTFKNNYLSLQGVKTGSPVWTANIGAQYVGGIFSVGNFSIGKDNITLNNRYNDGWLLK